MSETSKAPASASKAPPFPVQRSFAEVEKEMRPGDVIAFSGTHPISWLTRFLTRSRVSHVAIVGPPSNDVGCTLVESVWKGVQSRCAKTRIERAPAEVWWLPLSDDSRGCLDNHAFASFLNSVQGRKFDLRQPLAAMIDIGRKGLDLFWSKEDLETLFCAELVAAALSRSGVVPSLNASEVSPIDICRWSIFRGECVQLRGKRRPISRHNTELPMSSRYEKRRARTPAVWATQ